MNSCSPRFIILLIIGCILFPSISIISYFSDKIQLLENKISHLQTQSYQIEQTQDNILEVQLYTYFLFSEICGVDGLEILPEEQEEIEDGQSIPKDQYVPIDFDVRSSPVLDNKDNHSAKSQGEVVKDSFSVTSVEEPFDFVSKCFSKCMMWSLGDRKRCVASCMPI